MNKVLGIDISVHQGDIDLAKAWKAGARFVVMRATVGDYYTDPNFTTNYKKAREAAEPWLVSAYHVAAPADAKGRKIDGPTQMQRFRDVLGGRRFDLPLVLDAELDRGQAKDWVTRVMLDCVERIPYFTDSQSLGLIYTRQSWWDKWVAPSPEWKKYSLWPARSKAGLTSPWSDGANKFRDWESWVLWQFSSDYDYNGEGKPPGNYRGAEFGAKSSHIDLNWFNGDEKALQLFCGKEIKPEDGGENGDQDREGKIWEAIEELRKTNAILTDDLALVSGKLSEVERLLVTMKNQVVYRAEVPKMKISL